MLYIARTGLAILGVVFCSIAVAQPTLAHMPAGMHVQLLQNVHVAGKILVAGKASGDDNVMHLMVGVKLNHPLKNGGESVVATIIHNEPSEKVQTAMSVHSGGVADVGSVDVTCPRVRVVSYKGKINAFGEECTLNSYNL